MAPAAIVQLEDAHVEQHADFASTWRASVSTGECEAQTDEVEVAHAKTQHPKTKEEKTQSEAATEMGAVPMVRTGFQKLRELDAFLEQCTPLLEAQLQRNLTSRAFDGQPFVALHWACYDLERGHEAPR